MLTVARKPIVQYVAEELVANGLSQILFVTSRTKSSIENHFDSDPELLRLLKETNKTELLDEIRFEESQANFFYTRQRVQRGLGDAILCGENFAGDQPFVVALGDSIVGLNAQSRALSRMVDLFEAEHATCVIAVEEVPMEETMNYGVIRMDSSQNGYHRALNLVEKPKPAEAPSNLAIAGRYVFSPRIFGKIREVQPDKKGEIQLTDAIQKLCEEGERVLAVKLPPNEKRYDIGNFPSYFETFVEFALADPVHGPEFRTTVERLLRKSE
jgi:UTP--glucose-1-phosphate uridylyltransferase